MRIIYYKYLVIFLLIFITSSYQSFAQVKREESANAICRSRYGSTDRYIVNAWEILLSIGYKSSENYFLQPEKMVALHPGFTYMGQITTHNVQAESRDILPAWDLFMHSLPSLSSNANFRADLCGISAEVLSRYANTLQRKCAHALSEKEKAAFKTRSEEFINLLLNLQSLLNSNLAFSEGQWLPETQKNRKNLLLESIAQWKLVLSYSNSCLLLHHKFDENAIELKIKKVHIVNSDISSHVLPNWNPENEIKELNYVYNTYVNSNITSN